MDKYTVPESGTYLINGKQETLKHGDIVELNKPQTMLLIEKKVIEEITFNIEGQAGDKHIVVSVSDLLDNSNKVEVVDIKTARKNWLEQMDKDTFDSYLEQNGYKLIKIKQ